MLSSSWDFCAKYFLFSSAKEITCLNKIEAIGWVFDFIRRFLFRNYSTITKFATNKKKGIIDQLDWKQSYLLCQRRHWSKCIFIIWATFHGNNSKMSKLIYICNGYKQRLSQTRKKIYLLLGMNYKVRIFFYFCCHCIETQ